MSDPRNFGSDELTQRLRDLTEDAPDQASDLRQRSYRAAPAPPSTPASNGRKGLFYDPFEPPPEMPRPVTTAVHSQSLFAQQLEAHAAGRPDLKSANRVEPAHAASIAVPQPDPLPHPEPSHFQTEPPPEPLVTESSPAFRYSAEPFPDHAHTTQTFASANGALPGSPNAPAPVTHESEAGESKSRTSDWETVHAPEAFTLPELSTKPETATAVPPPSTETSTALKTGLQRTLEAIRSALPMVQKLLPLLDGNIATAIGAFVATQSHHPTAPVVQQRVDLQPLERSLTEIHNSHRELRGQVIEQAASFKRVEDQLERVREATDRNTLEQQELVEDIRSVTSRVGAFAIVGVVLLALSLGLNLYFLIQIQHILR